MSNSSRYDQFSDFLAGDFALKEGGGILDSPGLRDYEGIETSVQAEGAEVILNCRSCNKKRKVTLEWPELVVLGENGPGLKPFMPRGWKFSENNRTGYLELRCPSCGNDSGFAIHMSPDEAKGHVQAGLSSGLLPLGVVQSLRQQVHVQRGGR